MASLYGSLSALKSTLNITATTWDTDLTAALTAASRAIDEDCGRRFWQDSGATVVRYYSPVEPYQLEIDDLSSGATVAVDTGGTGTYSTVWTEGTHFHWSPFNAATDSEPYTTLQVRSQSGAILPAYPKSVKITGQWGWPAVPDAVTQATTILASRLFKRAREAPFSVFGLGVDGSAVRISRTDPDVASLIAPYNRSRFFL